MALLLRRSPIDAQDPLEELWVRAVATHRGTIESAPLQTLLPSLEAAAVQFNATLQSQSPLSLSATAPSVSDALLMMLLSSTKPDATSLLTRLTDSGKHSDVYHHIALQFAKQFLMSKLPYATDNARAQALWLATNMITVNSRNSDEVLLALLRNCEGGDVSPRNLRLTEAVLSLLSSPAGSSWLSHEHNRNSVVPTAFYTFLRLTVDHDDPSLKHLQDAEIGLVASLWSRFPSQCATCGREIIRLFNSYGLQRHRGLAPIWTTLSTETPTSPLSVPSLMRVKAPKVVIVTRVPFELDTQLLFVLRNVKLGQQKRYQAWMAQRFFSTRLSDTLVVDVVRYLCCAFHPSNKLLQSAMVPRWAMLGWLVALGKTPQALGVSREALLFDMLMFDGPKSIMYIEPAILLMVRSLPKFADMTTSLLEVLVMLSKSFHGTMLESVRASLNASFHDCVKVGVVKSLTPIASIDMSPQLKETLSTLCPALFSGTVPSSPVTVKGEPPTTEPRTTTPTPIMHPASPMGGNGDGSPSPSVVSTDHKRSSTPFPLPDMKRPRPLVDSSTSAITSDEGDGDVHMAGMTSSGATGSDTSSLSVTTSDVPTGTVSEDKQEGGVVAVNIPELLQFAATELVEFASCVEQQLQSVTSTGTPTEVGSPVSTSPGGSTRLAASLSVAINAVVNHVASNSEMSIPEIGLALGKVFGKLMFVDLMRGGVGCSSPHTPLAELFAAFVAACDVGSEASASRHATTSKTSPKGLSSSAAAHTLLRELLAYTLVGMGICSGDDTELGSFGYRTIGLRLLTSLLSPLSEVSEGVSSSTPTDAQTLDVSTQSTSPAVKSELYPYAVFANASYDRQSQTGAPLPVVPSTHNTGTASSHCNDAFKAQIAFDVWSCCDVDCLVPLSDAAFTVSNTVITLPTSQLCTMLVDVFTATAAALSHSAHAVIVEAMCENADLIRFLCAHMSQGHVRRLREYYASLSVPSDGVMSGLLTMNPATTKPDDFVKFIIGTSTWSEKEQLLLWLMVLCELRVVSTHRHDIIPEITRQLKVWCASANDTGQIIATMVDTHLAFIQPAAT